MLCPPALRGYSYTGKIYPQEKDTLTYIGQNLIVNIDAQLKALNKRDENELKNLITCPMVKYRMPYDKYVEEYPHLANFAASVNGNDFLIDPTGSRRFLPFEVLSIDIERAKGISMDSVYAEAKALLSAGFCYWFDDDEIAELYQERGVPSADRRNGTSVVLLRETDGGQSPLLLYDHYGNSYISGYLYMAVPNFQTYGRSP